MGNKEKILSCSLHLFYEKGYDAVGVQEIAQAAGISKPTLYYYFKSKRGLLESLLESKCRPLNEQLREAGEKTDDLKNTLMGIAEVYLGMASTNREFYFFMIALFYAARENESYKLIAPYFTEQFQIVKNVFDNFAGLLGNMNGRQDQFAVAFMGIINNYILVHYQRMDEGEYLASPELAYSLVHQFMHGIFS